MYRAGRSSHRSDRRGKGEREIWPCLEAVSQIDKDGEVRREEARRLQAGEGRDRGAEEAREEEERGEEEDRWDLSRCSPPSRFGLRVLTARGGEVDPFG